MLNARRVASGLIHSVGGFTPAILESSRVGSTYAHSIHRHRILTIRRVLSRALTHALAASYTEYDEQGATVEIIESGDPLEVEEIVTARQNDLISNDDAKRLVAQQLCVSAPDLCGGDKAEKDDDGTQSEAGSARSAISRASSGS